jgi:hypothetical protein
MMRINQTMQRAQYRMNFRVYREWKGNNAVPITAQNAVTVMKSALKMQERSQIMFAFRRETLKARPRRPEICSIRSAISPNSATAKRRHHRAAGAA